MISPGSDKTEVTKCCTYIYEKLLLFSYNNCVIYQVYPETTYRVSTHIVQQCILNKKDLTVRETKLVGNERVLFSTKNTESVFNKCSV